MTIKKAARYIPCRLSTKKYMV